MDEGLVSANVQKRLADANSELDLDDATKIIGCYKAADEAGSQPGSVVRSSADEARPCVLQEYSQPRS